MHPRLTYYALPHAAPHLRGLCRRQQRGECDRGLVRREGVSEHSIVSGGGVGVGILWRTSAGVNIWQIKSTEVGVSWCFMQGARAEAVVAGTSRRGLEGRCECQRR